MVAWPSDAFVDSIGVCTHFPPTTTSYLGRLDGCIRALNDIGIRHVRDEVAGTYNSMDNRPAWIATLQALSAAGIGYDLVVYNDDRLADVVAAAPQIAQPIALENINEPGPQGFSYAGPHYGQGWSLPAQVAPDWNGSANPGDVRLFRLGGGWGPTSIWYCTAAGSTRAPATGRPGDPNWVWWGVNDVRVLGNRLTRARDGLGWTCPVVGPSWYVTKPGDWTRPVAGQADWATYSSRIAGCDVENWHNYVGPPDHPDALPFIVEYFPIGPNSANARRWVTEFGSQTQGTTYEIEQASRILHGLLYGFANGFERHFIYELLDEPGSTWGILRSDLSYKKVAHQLRTFIRLLGDPGRRISPTSLAVDVAAPSPVGALLLAKRDGTFWLCLWLLGHDPASSISVSTTVTFGAAVTGAQLFSPHLLDADPAPTFGGGTSVSFKVGADPVVLKIQP